MEPGEHPPPSPDGEERWIRIQQKTFTNWVNHQLKERDLSITNLGTDLSDGIALLQLLEIISKKSVGKYNKNPKIMPHKLENTLLALNFLLREGVKLVNIGNEDIVNGNLKLILGLIWTLIFRYHITKGKQEASAKNELLKWVRSKIPEYDIKNFHKDWNDGRAICALVNAIGPGLCPNHWDLPGSQLERATKGVNLAQKRLNIPPVLNPADMVSPDIDELSMMTYISFFRNASLADLPLPVAEGPGLIAGKVGEPADFKILRNKADGDITAEVYSPTGEPVKMEMVDNGDGTYSVTYHPTVAGKHLVHVKLDDVSIPNSPWHPLIDIDVTKIRAHGPGLIRGKVGEVAPFVVEPNGNDGILAIKVTDPRGKEVPCKFVKNDKGDYDCEYVPDVSGEHTVDIKMNDQHIPESPFHPIIDIDPTKIRAHGPGLIRGKVGEVAPFVVEPNGNDGDLTIKVTDPRGKEIPCKFVKNSKGDYDCEYVPEVSGKHQVDIKMDNKEIPESPFFPIIDIDVNRIRAHGPGLIKGKVGDVAPFVVEPNGNLGDLTIKVTDPRGKEIPCKFVKNDKGDYDCEYVPEVSGKHEVDIKMDDKEIPESPFHPIIGIDLNRIRAQGPGLVGGMAGIPTDFLVEPFGNLGNLTVTIEDPKGRPVEVEVVKNEEGDYHCKYLPEFPGEYVVNIKMDGEHIPDSAFRPVFEPDVTKVRAYGPGLVEGWVNQPAPFVVETNGHDGFLQAVVECPIGEIPCAIIKREDGNYDCQYEPPVPGEYLISLTLNNKDVPESPFYVVIKDDFRNVKCKGPGLEGGFVDIPSEFTVFPNGHVGKLKVWVQGPEDPAVATVVQNADGTYGVTYTPTAPGEYYVNVTMDDQHVPGSPFLVLVLAKKRSGPSLGGEGKIRVFYSSTSGMDRVKNNQKKLQEVLERRKVHLRPDFEPWIALDVGLDPNFRKMVFAKAGRTEAPLMFIDDEPAPPPEEIFQLDKEGKFDELLRFMPKFDL